MKHNFLFLKFKQIGFIIPFAFSSDIYGQAAADTSANTQLYLSLSFCTNQMQLPSSFDTDNFYSPYYSINRPTGVNLLFDIRVEKNRIAISGGAIFWSKAASLVLGADLRFSYSPFSSKRVKYYFFYQMDYLYSNYRDSFLLSDGSSATIEETYYCTTAGVGPGTIFRLSNRIYADLSMSISAGFFSFQPEKTVNYVPLIFQNSNSIFSNTLFTQQVRAGIIYRL